MSRGRFQTLIEHHQRQEDQLRAQMVQVDARMASISDDQAHLQAQREAAAASVQFGFYEEFLAFSRLCDDRQAAFSQELEQLRGVREQIQAALLLQWRRRRSLETVQRRQAEQQQHRRQRREDAELLDSSVRAWYLRQDDLNPQAAEDVPQLPNCSEVVL